MSGKGGGARGGRGRRSNYGDEDPAADPGDGAQRVAGGVFKNAAFEILKQEERLMTSGEITKLAIERRLLKCMGKTPENTMASALYTEVRKKAATTVFIKPKEGLFGLKAWLTEPWLVSWLATEGIEPEDLLTPQAAAAFAAAAMPAEHTTKKARTSYNGSVSRAASGTGFFVAGIAGGPGVGSGPGSLRTSMNGLAVPPLAVGMGGGGGGGGSHRVSFNGLPTPTGGAVGHRTSLNGLAVAPTSSGGARGGFGSRGGGGVLGGPGGLNASDSVSNLHLLLDAADEIEGGRTPPSGGGNDEDHDTANDGDLPPFARPPPSRRRSDGVGRQSSFRNQQPGAAAPGPAAVQQTSGGGAGGAAAYRPSTLSREPSLPSIMTKCRVRDDDDDEEEEEEEEGAGRGARIPGLREEDDEGDGEEDADGSGRGHGRGQGQGVYGSPVRKLPSHLRQQHPFGHALEFGQRQRERELRELRELQQQHLAQNAAAAAAGGSSGGAADPQQHPHHHYHATGGSGRLLRGGPRAQGSGSRDTTGPATSGDDDGAAPGAGSKGSAERSGGGGGVRFGPAGSAERSGDLQAGPRGVGDGGTGEMDDDGHHPGVFRGPRGGRSSGRRTSWAGNAVLGAGGSGGGLVSRGSRGSAGEAPNGGSGRRAAGTHAEGMELDGGGGSASGGAGGVGGGNGDGFTAASRPPLAPPLPLPGGPSLFQRQLSSAKASPSLPPSPEVATSGGPTLPPALLSLLAGAGGHPPQLFQGPPVRGSGAGSSGGGGIRASSSFVGGSGAGAGLPPALTSPSPPPPPPPSQQSQQQLPTTEQVVEHLRAVLASNGALGVAGSSSGGGGCGLGFGFGQLPVGLMGAVGGGLSSSGLDLLALLGGAGAAAGGANLAWTRASPTGAGPDGSPAAALGLMSPRLASLLGAASSTHGPASPGASGGQAAGAGKAEPGASSPVVKVEATQEPASDAPMKDAGPNSFKEAGAAATPAAAPDGAAAGAKPEPGEGPAHATAPLMTGAAAAVHEGMNSPDSQDAGATAAVLRTSDGATGGVDGAPRAADGGEGAGAGEAGAPAQPPPLLRKVELPGTLSPVVAAVGLAATPGGASSPASGGGGVGSPQQQLLARQQQQTLELLPPVEAARPGDVPDPEAINRIRTQVLDMESRMGMLHRETGRAYVLLARVLEHKGTAWSLAMAERALLRAWTITGFVTSSGAARRRSESGAGAAAVAGVAEAAAAEAGGAGVSELLCQLPDSFHTFQFMLEQIRMKQSILHVKQQQQLAALLQLVAVAGMSGAAAARGTGAAAAAVVAPTAVPADSDPGAGLLGALAAAAEAVAPERGIAAAPAGPEEAASVIPRDAGEYGGAGGAQSPSPMLTDAVASAST